MLYFPIQYIVESELFLFHCRKHMTKVPTRYSKCFVSSTNQPDPTKVQIFMASDFDTTTKQQMFFPPGLKRAGMADNRGARRCRAAVRPSRGRVLGLTPGRARDEY